MRQCLLSATGSAPFPVPVASLQSVSSSVISLIVDGICDSGRNVSSESRAIFRDYVVLVSVFIGLE